MKQADLCLIKEINRIKQDHPLWGYRRVWAYLRYREQRVVGKNRIYRIMKENNLLVTKNLRLKAKRGELRPKPQADYLNQFWGMDMTKILFPNGWGYLHVVKDWYSKEIVGWQFSLMSRTDDWLEALNNAVNRCFPNGIYNHTPLPSLITDNGCQPTSERFMRDCATLGMKQIFTSYNNPKGNADTERLMRTIKEDLVWIYEWKSSFAFEQAFEKWVDDYNNDYPHMSLGYKTPSQFANDTLLKAA